MKSLCLILLSLALVGPAFAIDSRGCISEKEICRRSGERPSVCEKQYQECIAGADKLERIEKLLLTGRDYCYRMALIERRLCDVDGRTHQECNDLYDDLIRQCDEKY